MLGRTGAGRTVSLVVQKFLATTTSRPSKQGHIRVQLAPQPTDCVGVPSTSSWPVAVSYTPLARLRRETLHPRSEDLAA
jgi:hypothetical protein